MKARATKKCTVRLPGKLVRDANELIRRFGPTLSPHDGRFSRDRYVSSILAGALEDLAHESPNSSRAHQFLNEQLRLDPDRRSHTVVNLNLDAEVAQRLEEIKNAKNIPRDLIIRAVFESLVSGLRKISDVGADPINPDWTHSCELRSLFVADDEIAERNGLVEEAIAELKNVPLASASKAYWSLTPERRKQLRSRGDVQAIVRRLETARENARPIDLSDLIPPMHRKRARRGASR